VQENSSKGDGARAANKFLRCSRYQGDILETCSNPSEIGFFTADTPASIPGIEIANEVHPSGTQ
jgi:hypothetical protein